MSLSISQILLDCFIPRTEKSAAEDDSAEETLSQVPASVRTQNHERKINNLKRKMAQISNVRNKGKREALLADANALLVDVTENSA